MTVAASLPGPAPVFLTARWRQLAMLNYAVDPAALAPLIPPGVEPDTFEGRSYVSLVGFLFERTRVFGLRFPWHSDFEEVNLRFYVRRWMGATEGWRRGTVFVRELVPRRIIATLARVIYHEPYWSCPMSHEVAEDRAEYRWKIHGCPYALAVVGTPGAWQEIAAGSEGEFITEHYWGYNRQRHGGTLEYQVEHPRWRFRPARECRFEGDASALYGQGFAAALGGPPSSAFLVAGSEVQVRRGRRVA